MSVKGISKLLLTGLLSQGLCRLRYSGTCSRHIVRWLTCIRGTLAVVYKISGYTEMHSICARLHVRFLLCLKAVYYATLKGFYNVLFMLFIYAHCKKSFLRCCFQVAVAAKHISLFTVGNFRKCFRLSEASDRSFRKTRRQRRFCQYCKSRCRFRRHSLCKGRYYRPFFRTR